MHFDQNFVVCSDDARRFRWSKSRLQFVLDVRLALFFLRLPRFDILYPRKFFDVDPSFFLLLIFLDHIPPRLRSFRRSCGDRVREDFAHELTQMLCTRLRPTMATEGSV